MSIVQLLDVGLVHFLVLAAALFSLGTFTILTRRNAVGVLLGVELILNAANINLVAFSEYVTGAIDGHVFALFLIVLAAAEAAIALAIVLAIFQNLNTIDATQANMMKE